MQFEQFHFHIYYELNEVEIEKAKSLVKDLTEMDDIQIGRFWDKPVGPHPVGSCQITVSDKKFYEMTQWFLLNRKGLSIFVHALSGDNIIDHTDYVMWIGNSYKLNLDFFEKIKNN